MLDALIAGGGASGLSLACRLATSGWGDRRVLVVDDGRVDLDGRSWAWWDDLSAHAGGGSGPATAASWSRLRVHADGRDVPVRLRRFRYQQVRGADLGRWATQVLATAPGIRLERGHVDAVREIPGGAEAVVDGRPVRARWVFDSVTAPRPAAPVWLAFHGWQVRTAADTFDPSTPTLMDFRTPQQGEVRFLYVLPSSPRRALVELTRFGPGAPADAPAALDRYLGQVLRTPSYDVEREEAGLLPLEVPAARDHRGHVLAIGNRGGMLKASTGYAYGRIRRDSAAVTASLVRHGHPHDLPRPRWRHRFLDAVLLGVLAREPGAVEPAFARLFARNPGDRILRFLDEDTAPVQEARLVATLPPAAFVRVALSGSWPR